MGYADGVKGYRLWCSDPKSPKFIISRDVKFDESTILNPKKDSDESTKRERTLKKVELEVEAPSRPETQSHLKNIDDQVSVEDSNSDNAAEADEPHSIATHRQRREIRPPQRYADLVAHALTIAGDQVENEPLSYSDAIMCKDSDRWMVAITEEIESLHKNQTWDLVKLPKGSRAIGYKWVFKRKEGIPGIEDARYKARLVAKGYSQKEGIDSMKFSLLL